MPIYEYKPEPDDPIMHVCSECGGDMIVLFKHWASRDWRRCPSCRGMWVRCPDCDQYQPPEVWCRACGAELPQ